MLTITSQNSMIDAQPEAVIDLAIAAWLDAKSKRSGSTETKTAYHDTLADFRLTLQSVDLDLASDIRAIALTAQAWAGASKVGRDVSAGTFRSHLIKIDVNKASQQQTKFPADNPMPI